MSTEMSTEDPHLGSKRPREEDPQEVRPVFQRRNTAEDAIKVALKQSNEAQEKRLMSYKGIKFVKKNTSYGGCVLWVAKDNLFHNGMYKELLKHMSAYVGLEFDVQELGLLQTTTLVFSNEDGELKGTGMVQILNKEGAPGGAIKMDLSSQVGKHFTLEQAKELKTKFAEKLILVPIYYAGVKINREWVIDTTNGVKKDFHLYFGGKNMANESPYDTIVRELAEEIGLNSGSIQVGYSKTVKKIYYNSPGSKVSSGAKPFSKLSHKITTEMWDKSIGKQFNAPVHIVSTPLATLAISSSPPNVIRRANSDEPHIFIPIST